MGVLSVLLFVVLSIWQLASRPADYAPPPERAGGWRTNTDPAFVASLGLDPERLEAFGRYNLAVRGDVPDATHYKACIVIKSGWIVGEWYEGAGASSYLQYLSSNGKVWAKLLMGVLIHDGGSFRLDSRLYDPRWLAEGFPLSDPQKASITFEQILMHTSGILPEARGDTRRGLDWDFRSYTVGRDPRYPESAPLYSAPGSDRQYSSVAFNHLSLVFRNVTGMPPARLLASRILNPIGIEEVEYIAYEGMGDFEWATSGQTGPRMTPRDYARLAYLLSKNGRWGSRQLVPEEWVRRLVTSTDLVTIRSNHDAQFGREYPRDMFRLEGSGLNWAFVVPSLDLIAIRTGRAPNFLKGEVLEEFLRRLFEAVSLE